MEDLGEPAVRLGGAASDQADVRPRRRLDGGRSGMPTRRSSDSRGTGLGAPLRRSAAAMPYTDARHALLARLIDHAPMFPPASLSPADALVEDARAAASPHAFMLRLVWPASRLVELPPSERAISAVLDAPIPSGFPSRPSRLRRPSTRLRVMQSSSWGGVRRDADRRWRRGSARPARRAGARAKVRCGGASVPSVALAAFVRACRERGLVFKATAGLHHAVRSNGVHGFLNLLAAAAFAGEEEGALAEPIRRRSLSTAGRSPGENVRDPPRSLRASGAT